MQLFHDAGAVLLFPVPALLQKAVPAQIVLVDALLLQLVDDLDLGGDSRVVRARLPQGLVALHPLVTGDNILQRRIPGMPQVQLAGNIRRRDHDTERILAFVAGCEIAFFDPVVIALFYIQMVIFRGQFLFHQFFLLFFIFLR